jgi:hypothetical protein
MVVLSFDPKTKQVERDKEIFLRLLGECVSLWAFLDRELFHLTKTALGTDDKRTAIVFYFRQDLTNHLTLVDRLMKHGVSEDHFLHKWRPLHKVITRHLATRSIYAHQPTRRTGTGKNNRAFYYYSIHIEPAQQQLGGDFKQGLGDKKELLTKDLKKHAHSLEKLVKEVSDFHAFFKKHPKPNS